MIQTEKQMKKAGDKLLLAEFLGSQSEQAFAELVARHGSYVQAIARRRLGNSGLADDAAQQVFILLSKKAKTLVNHPCLKAWLHRATVFEAANLARKEKTYLQKKTQAHEEFNSTKSIPDTLGVDEALASLRPEERQILILHYHQELQFAEVSRQFGISEAAAQKRAHRALGRLSEKLKARGHSEANTKQCAGLLLALTSEEKLLSQSLVEKIVTAGSLTSSAVSTVSVVIGVGLFATAMGAGAFALKTKTHPRVSELPKRSHSVAMPPSQGSPSITHNPKEYFQPETTDEELPLEIQQFITLAQTDTEQAFIFAKEQDAKLIKFLRRAVRHLADRDLAAANRFLLLVEASDPREVTVQGIFASLIRRDFNQAILWVESLPYPHDKEGHRFGSPAQYINNQYLNYDYVSALEFAESDSVRTWLLHQICERAVDRDENRFMLLADQLQGRERHLVLTYAASTLLQRGDERAFELLEEAKPNFEKLPMIREVALRDPEPLLNWLATQDDEVNRTAMIQSLMNSWAQSDVENAARWWVQIPQSRIRELGFFSDRSLHSDLLERKIETLRK